MKRKFFAFDIDGTLLDSNKQPLNSTLEALDKLKKAGHVITIATGRSRFLAKDVILSLGFENYILCNGAAAFLSHQQVYKNLLDRQELNQFIQEAQQMGIDTAFVGMDGLSRATSMNLEVMESAMTSFGAQTPELKTGFLEEVEIYQALGFFNAEQETKFSQEYQKLRFIRWHESGVDVVPKTGSKAATISHIADQLGIDRADVISFGDGLNDREMLQSSGVGVAMGNASAEIQEVADIVTASNDEDGIWLALKKLELI